MNTLLKTLLLGAGLSLALAACASAPPAKAPATAANQEAGCVPQTASRLAPGASNCAGFGHAWSQEDIQRSGGADTAEALRLLDPSLTIHGH